MYIPSLLPRFLQTWHFLLCRDWAQYWLYCGRLRNSLPQCKARPRSLDGSPSGYLIPCRGSLWQCVWQQQVPGAWDRQWNRWSVWEQHPWRGYPSCPIPRLPGSWCSHLQDGAHGINVCLGEFINANASLSTVFQFVHFAVLLKKITAFAGEDPNKEEPSWISLPLPC